MRTIASVMLAGCLALSLWTVWDKIQRYEPECLPTSWQVERPSITPEQKQSENINLVYKEIES
jgi:hypothetical protein